MEPSCPLGTTRVLPQEKFPQKPYNKSFIDQTCSVKMAGYWPRSFFACLWTSTSSRSINTQKKELGQYPAIVTEQAWSITHTYFSCHKSLWRLKNPLIIVSFHSYYGSIGISVSDVTYQTRDTVFHRHIETPSRELKLRRAAEYF